MLKRLPVQGGAAVLSQAGRDIYGLAAEIYPICRSLTGNGVRETLGILSRHVPLQIHDVPTGTQVFDWTIPKEWNLKYAHLRAPDGTIVVSSKDSPLHVMGYSRPVHTVLPLEDLKRHITTLPEQPNLIPYRTAYAGDRWGFCMSQRQFESLSSGSYEVVIDATLKDGYLTYGEIYQPGETDDEVLLSAHICHPSLANDNCSGLALLSYLARLICRKRTRLSYRLLFGPGTIGAITWLARNQERVHRIKHGIVVSCAGDRSSPSYKQSRQGNALVDRAFSHILPDSAITAFSPYGYDERQYGSPGFNLPVGLFQRSRNGTFPEYHTSADNLDFIDAEALGDSCRILLDVIDILERDGFYRNTNPFCEPNLGRRGLYPATGGHTVLADRTMALLWVLNLSDGEYTLLDIANRSQLPFGVIANAALDLETAGLLAPAGLQPLQTI